jgi:protein-S-isoprenylcysteine O-methyltransferase Ste14
MELKNIKTKDKFFVGIQLILFVFYFIPMLKVNIDFNKFIAYSSLGFALFGVLIVLLAVLQLNKNLSPFPTPVENSSLLTNGMFKYVRHPIYTGIILTTVFFGIFEGSLWKILVGFSLFVLFYFKSNYEEQLLLNEFEQYSTYMKTTKRFFPFI